MKKKRKTLAEWKADVVMLRNLPNVTPEFAKALAFARKRVRMIEALRLVQCYC